MEVDLYSYCPCGSGKKIKFCTKCRDTIGELDKIARMTEGGQMVAAMDRTNQVLEDHPDAAWALAVRGRILLQLRENGKLEENADRFLRLQPSNPLALLQKAAAMLGKGDIPAATNSVLAAMAEARETHDSLLLEIAAALGMVLAESGNLLSARAYLGVASMVDVQVAETAIGILNEIGQNRSLNVLLKHLPDTWSSPPGVAWGERYDEANRLLEINGVLLAESKFQALDRQYPQQAAILAALLRCAIWRADQEAQSRLFAKMAEVTSLPEEDRDRCRALSYLTEEGQPKLEYKSRDLVWELSHVDTVLAALTADSQTVTLQPEMVREMIFEEGGIPPKAAFQLLDREKSRVDELPPIDITPEVIGMLLIYGRQTDQPARLMALNVLQRDESRVLRQVANAIGGETQPPQNGEDHGAPMLSVLMGATPALKIRNTTPAALNNWRHEVLNARAASRFLDTPLKLLDNQTPAEAAAHPNHRPKLSALVRILEGYDLLASEAPSAMAQIRSQLNIPELPQMDLGSKEAARVPAFQIGRLRIAGLGAQDSLVLLERARMSSLRLAVRQIAEHILQLSLGDDLKSAKITAYMVLAEASPDALKGLEYLEAAKLWVKANGASNAPLLLSEIGFRLQGNDIPGLQRVIQSIVSEHGSNQKVMAQLQQIMVMYGLLNPDGSQRRVASPAAAAPIPASSGGGKLWTPDAPAGAAPSSGGSKLWVPGMD